MCATSVLRRSEPQILVMRVKGAKTQMYLERQRGIDVSAVLSDSSVLLTPVVAVRKQNLEENALLFSACAMRPPRIPNILGRRSVGL